MSFYASDYEHSGNSPECVCKTVYREEMRVRVFGSHLSLESVYVGWIFVYHFLNLHPLGSLSTSLYLHLKWGHSSQHLVPKYRMSMMAYSYAHDQCWKTPSVVIIPQETFHQESEMLNSPWKNYWYWNTKQSYKLSLPTSPSAALRSWECEKLISN